MKGTTPIGYRYEERGDLLRIHSANRLLQALLLLLLLACIGLPLLLRGELAGRSGGDMVVALLALIALPALGVACAWYFPVRETLELERAGRRVQRCRHNLFGGRARVEEAFALEDGDRLQLRQTGAASAPGRLRLLGFLRCLAGHRPWPGRGLGDFFRYLCRRHGSGTGPAREDRPDHRHRRSARIPRPRTPSRR